MNRANIIRWMEDYTPIESDFREYYRTHNYPVTEKTFFQIIQKHHGLDNTVNSAFHNLDAADTPPIPENPNMNTKFSDMVWLQKAQDISIRKHPRYFPPLKHTHTFIEIAYVFRGNCRQTFYFSDSHLTEEITLTEGSLCIIPPGLEHAISVFDDSIVINILIRTSTMKRTLTELIAGNHALFDFFIYTLYENSTQNFLLFDTHNSEAIQSFLLGMMLELCEEKPYSQRTTHLMLGLVFTYLQRDCSDSLRFSKYASSGIGYIPQILSYIHENYRTTSVEDIAEHFYISRSYLSRVFKAHTNSTIIQTLQQVRLQNACDYLENTQMSVQNISDAVGYGDVTFFIRAFKKTYGTTPLQYRKQHQI